MTEILQKSGTDTEQDGCAEYNSYLQSLTTLMEQYPFLTVEFFHWGEDGKPLPLLTLGEGERGVLYVGTDAGDGITAALLLRFAQEYAEGYRAGTRVFGTCLPRLWRERRILLLPLFRRGPHLPLRMDTDREFCESLGNYLRFGGSFVKNIVFLRKGAGKVRPVGKPQPALTRMLAGLSGYLPVMMPAGETADNGIVPAFSVEYAPAGDLFFPDGGFPKENARYWGAYATLRQLLFEGSLLL